MYTLLSLSALPSSRSPQQAIVPRSEADELQTIALEEADGRLCGGYGWWVFHEEHPFRIRKTSEVDPTQECWQLEGP
jgi:hypothetical protein